MADEVPSDSAVRPMVAHDVDSMDACVFTGDGFHTPEGLAYLRWYLARWSKEADAIEQMLKEGEIG